MFNKCLPRSSSLIGCIKVNLWDTSFRGLDGKDFILFPQHWLDLKSKLLGCDLFPFMILGS